MRARLIPATSPGAARILDVLQVNSRELVQAPEDFDVAESQFARVECEQMIVRKDGIAFAAIPKHGDFHVSTAEIPMEWLESASQPVPVVVQSLSP